MGAQYFFAQKTSKSFGFLNIKPNFKIIVIDLQSSFFDVVRKGDVHENVFSKPFIGDFLVRMFYLRRV